MTKAVNVIGLTDLVTQFQYLTFALGEIQAYPILLSLVLHRCYVFYKQDSSLEKDYDSLYWNICFDMVVWKRTSNISEVCLHRLLFCTNNG